MNADSPKAREGDLVRLLVDVDGYLSKRIIPRGTDGVVWRPTPSRTRVMPWT